MSILYRNLCFNWHLASINTLEIGMSVMERLLWVMHHWYLFTTGYNITSLTLIFFFYHLSMLMRAEIYVWWSREIQSGYRWLEFQQCRKFCKCYGGNVHLSRALYLHGKLSFSHTSFYVMIIFCILSSLGIYVLWGL